MYIMVFVTFEEINNITFLYVNIDKTILKYGLIGNHLRTLHNNFYDLEYIINYMINNYSYHTTWSDTKKKLIDIYLSFNQ